MYLLYPWAHDNTLGGGAEDIGEPDDFVRINVTARTAQRIADRFSARLPTTFILDEVFRQVGMSATPCIQPPSPQMASLAAMVDHSDAVEKKVEANYPRVVCNVGKHWVLTNRIFGKTGTAANYGWYDTTAPYRSASGYKMWQTLGTRHNDQHTDYSQVLQLVRSECEAGSRCIGFDALARDEVMCVIISDEGVLQLTRQPGVPNDRVDPTKPETNDTEPSMDEVEPPTRPDNSPLASAFIQARNYTRVDRSGFIKQIVIHTAESDEVFTASEALAKWCAGPNSPRASWHYAVDADSITQSVRDEHIAWHAPGCNKTGIGIELAGRAKQTPEEWNDDFSRRVLEKAAKLVAFLCKRWSIPVEFIPADGLKQGKKGITTHAEVSYAFRKSTHTDPGRGFPMQEFLHAVRSERQRL